MDEKGQADVAWWSLTTQITLKWPKLPRRVRRATPFPYRGSWWVMRKNLFRCSSQHLLLKGQLLKTLFVIGLFGITWTRHERCQQSQHLIQCKRDQAIGSPVFTEKWACLIVTCRLHDCFGSQCKGPSHPAGENWCTNLVSHSSITHPVSHPSVKL